MKAIFLDVSELEPPEPMTTILSALRTLPENYLLSVKHRREPWPLYQQLLAMGWAYRCDVVCSRSGTLNQSHYLIHIFRQSDQSGFDHYYQQRDA